MTWKRIDVPVDAVKQYLLRDGDVLLVRSSLKREGIGQSSVVSGSHRADVFSTVI
jgi:hypothetical protein